MGTILNRVGYQQLIDGDLEWLDNTLQVLKEQNPGGNVGTLERDHIRTVLK